jgi:type I restriction enzyme R subunit
MLWNCSVFLDADDGKRVKVVCRYQQYHAACRNVERLRQGETAAEPSGAVWHTQGLGKSLTMVFVARMLRTSTDLADFKIVMIIDRVDLEEQLSAKARLIGGKVNVIESTADHREHLKTDASDEHGDGSQIHGSRRRTADGSKGGAGQLRFTPDSGDIWRG